MNMVSNKQHLPILSCCISRIKYTIKLPRYFAYSMIHKILMATMGERTANGVATRTDPYGPVHKLWLSIRTVVMSHVIIYNKTRYFWCTWPTNARAKCVKTKQRGRTQLVSGDKIWSLLQENKKVYLYNFDQEQSKRCRNVLQRRILWEFKYSSLEKTTATK